MSNPGPLVKTAPVKFSDRRRTRISALLTALLLLAAGPAPAAIRTWTDDLNRTWQGEFVRVEGSSAVFLVNGKEFPFPMARLSASDKLLIFQLRQAASAAAAPSPTPALPVGQPGPAAPSGGAAATAPGGAGHSWTFGSVPVEPGKTVVTDLPLPAEDVAFVAKQYGDAAPHPTIIRASLAVPADFDPDKPQKVLIGSASATGDVLSIPVTRSTFAKEGLAHGYVILAADGGDGKPKIGDGPDYRLVLLKIALVELNARFPQAKRDWTFATAGFSGGAGYASFQALWLSTQGYRVGGMMLLNGGYTPTQWEHAVEMRGNTSRWHQIPVFISWGEKDGIAKPPLMQESINTTKHSGYQRVRAESFPGGHQAWGEHINLALEWFDSLASGAGH